MTGYIDYSIDGAYWYLDGVYAVGLYADYVSEFSGSAQGLYYTAAGYGYGALGAIYAPAYGYWYLGSYGASAGYLGGFYDGFWGDVYAFFAAYQGGDVYYLSYWGAGWLAAYNTGGAAYGYGDYDDLMGLYYYGYYEAAYVLTGLYMAYYAGLAYVYSWPFYYAGYYSTDYYGVELSGPYYVDTGSYYMYYDTWALSSWWGVFYGVTYGYYYGDAIAVGSYSYWYGLSAWSWYYDAEVSIDYSVSYTFMGYYDGEDYLGFSLYFVESDGLVGYDDSILAGLTWVADVGYVSSDIEVSYWIEYMATDLIEYYYAYA